jgi:hypothetical protein
MTEKELLCTFLRSYNIKILNGADYKSKFIITLKNGQYLTAG